ncbi:MAG: ribokinase [Rhodospirillales bacterium]|jgi:sulfofructose kinase|nr:ribokinase [Rhodospirillales bacterium]
MVSVVCLGIAIMDQVFAVENLPSGSGKNFAHDFMEIGGGPAATAAVAAVRLGAQTTLWARVGTDTIGGQIVTELSDYGVDVTGVRAIEGCRSTLASVCVDQTGERGLVSFTDPNLDADPSWLALDIVEKAGCVLADCRWPRGVEAIFGKAREVGVPSLLDGDLTPDKAVIGLAPLASHVAFSQGGLEQFSDTDDPVQGLRIAAQATDGWVCVTLGEKGAIWLEGGEPVHQPGFVVDTVDTVGAGDTFHGALAVALAEKQSIPDAVRFASATAALKCTRFGGRAGIPTRAEVDAYMRKA